MPACRHQTDHGRSGSRRNPRARRLQRGRQELGQIEDHKIYLSDLPDRGQFNMLLVVKFKNTSDLGRSKARYGAFMKEWGEVRNKETTQFAQKSYMAMREIRRRA